MNLQAVLFPLFAATSWLAVLGALFSIQNSDGKNTTETVRCLKNRQVEDLLTLSFAAAASITTFTIVLAATFVALITHAFVDVKPLLKPAIFTTSLLIFASTILQFLVEKKQTQTAKTPQTCAKPPRVQKPSTAAFTLSLLLMMGLCSLTFQTYGFNGLGLLVAFSPVWLGTTLLGLRMAILFQQHHMFQDPPKKWVFTPKPLPNQKNFVEAVEHLSNTLGNPKFKGSFVEIKRTTVFPIGTGDLISLNFSVPKTTDIDTQDLLNQAREAFEKHNAGCQMFCDDAFTTTHPKLKNLLRTRIVHLGNAPWSTHTNIMHKKQKLEKAKQQPKKP